MNRPVSRVHLISMTRSELLKLMELERSIVLKRAMTPAACLLMLMLMFCSCQSQRSTTAPLAPAAFIFGDSLVDCGNNNYILAVARGNIAPYGIDFPLGPTGRFCNGRTVVDVVGELLRLPLIPPYLDPSTKGTKILTGVSYASGAAGIIDETGGNYAERITFNQQIQWFQNTIGQLNSLIGSAAASQLVAKSLVAIIMGSNDYINNYFLRYTQAHKNYSPPAFRDLLLSLFSKQLKELYQLGARKIVVANVGPLGCIPSTLFLNNSTGTCVEWMNAIVRDFNDALKPMLEQLNSELPGAMFVYGNVYNGFVDLINNPSAYGFENANRGCCGAGPFNGQVPCLPAGLVKYCPDRSKYVFWDPYHPTDAANVVLGRRLFDGGPEDASPMNIHQLVLL